MRVGAVITGLALTAAWAAGQGASVKQEGQFWVRTGQTQALDLLPGITRLEFITRGRITVRGVEGNQFQIKMKQRVSAKTQADANREWGVYDVLQNSMALRPPVMRIAILPPASEKVSIDLEITVPRGLKSLGLQNQLGDIEVNDIDGDVVAITDGGAIRADRIKGSFRCSTGLGNVALGAAGGDTTCHTAGGDLHVASSGGVLTLTTEGGNIHVDKAGGNVRATSREGMIEIGEAKGVVTADTRGGLIHVGSANGVKAESAGGMVRLRGASGPMNVNTLMGNILAEILSGGRLQNSSMSTGRGDITLLVPESVGVTLRALHPSGLAPRIVSEFPEMNTRSVGFSSAAAQGALNGGGAVLNLNTSGVIYIRKSKE